MTSEQVALLISIFSVLIASLSIGWNIYRDVILKAKVKISLAVVFIAQQGTSDRPQFVNISATNFGPGVVNISMICAKTAPIWRKVFRKSKYAVIMYDYTNPMSKKLPAKLEVGDKIDLFLKYDNNCLLKEKFTHVGVSDFFGRRHWASRSDLKRAYDTWNKDFGGLAGNGQST